MRVAGISLSAQTAKAAANSASASALDALLRYAVSPVDGPNDGPPETLLKDYRVNALQALSGNAGLHMRYCGSRCRTQFACNFLISCHVLFTDVELRQLIFEFSHTHFQGPFFLSHGKDLLSENRTSLNDRSGTPPPGCRGGAQQTCVFQFRRNGARVSGLPLRGSEIRGNGGCI